MARKLAMMAMIVLIPGCSSTTAGNGNSDGAVVSDGKLDVSGSLDTGAKVDAGAQDASGSNDGAPFSCSVQCHGSATSTAPPKSIDGKSSTDSPGVGAHESHLATSTWHAQLQCSDCHVVPNALGDTGHIDTPLPAEVTFSGLANSNGASSVWARSSLTCTGSYCHGSTLSGGSATSPMWTKVDGSQSKCGSCHGMPPTQNHSTSTSCNGCHKAVVDGNQNIIAPALHIDGKLSVSGGHDPGYDKGSVHGPEFMNDPDSCKKCHGSDLTGGPYKGCDSCHPGWKKNCTFCHGGTDNTTGAPPESVDGQTKVTTASVGYHTSHVTNGATHLAFSCSMCHAMPADALTPGHIDTTPGAEVSFSGIAQGTVAAAYDANIGMCNNVYCHNPRTDDNNGGNPSWVAPLTGGCSACHPSNAAEMPGGLHKKHTGVTANLSCSECHACVVNATSQVTDPSKHVNGQADVCGSQIVSWTDGWCTSNCHATKKPWPFF